ncbi:unnamed protein product [Closterium sp. Naga37s-1]|nr:unnamed protein product [Closterium sp. Naga37s-1]
MSESVESAAALYNLLLCALLLGVVGAKELFLGELSLLEMHKLAERLIGHFSFKLLLLLSLVDVLVVQPVWLLWFAAVTAIKRTCSPTSCPPIFQPPPPFRSLPLSDVRSGGQGAIAAPQCVTLREPLLAPAHARPAAARAARQPAPVSALCPPLCLPCPFASTARPGVVFENVERKSTSCVSLRCSFAAAPRFSARTCALAMHHCAMWPPVSRRPYSHPRLLPHSATPLLPSAVCLLPFFAPASPASSPSASRNVMSPWPRLSVGLLFAYEPLVIAIDTTQVRAPMPPSAHLPIPPSPRTLSVGLLFASSHSSSPSTPHRSVLPCPHPPISPSLHPHVLSPWGCSLPRATRHRHRHHTGPCSHAPIRPSPHPSIPTYSLRGAALCLEPLVIAIDTTQVRAPMPPSAHLPIPPSPRTLSVGLLFASSHSSSPSTPHRSVLPCPHPPISPSLHPHVLSPWGCSLPRATRHRHRHHTGPCSHAPIRPSPHPSIPTYSLRGAALCLEPLVIAIDTTQVRAPMPPSAHLPIPPSPRTLSVGLLFASSHSSSPSTPHRSVLPCPHPPISPSLHPHILSPWGCSLPRATRHRHRHHTGPCSHAPIRPSPHPSIPTYSLRGAALCLEPLVIAIDTTQVRAPMPPSAHLPIPPSPRTLSVGLLFASSHSSSPSTPHRSVLPCPHPPISPSLHPHVLSPWGCSLPRATRHRHRHHTGPCSHAPIRPSPHPSIPTYSLRGAALCLEPLVIAIDTTQVRAPMPPSAHLPIPPSPRTLSVGLLFASSHSSSPSTPHRSVLPCPHPPISPSLHPHVLSPWGCSLPRATRHRHRHHTGPCSHAPIRPSPHPSIPTYSLRGAALCLEPLVIAIDTTQVRAPMPPSAHLPIPPSPRTLSVGLLFASSHSSSPSTPHRSVLPCPHPPISPSLHPHVLSPWGCSLPRATRHRHRHHTGPCSHAPIRPSPHPSIPTYSLRGAALCLEPLVIAIDTTQVRAPMPPSAHLPIPPSPRTLSVGLLFASSHSSSPSTPHRSPLVIAIDTTQVSAAIPACTPHPIHTIPHARSHASMSPPSVGLLFAYEPLAIAIDTTGTLLHYCVHLLEAHSDLLSAHLPPALPLTSLLASCEWAELRSWLLFNVSFTADASSTLLTLAHCALVLLIRGFSFSVIDLVLVFNIRTLLAALSKRVAGFLRWHAALRLLRSTFPDATPAQITAFADDCAICREPLSSAKRLPCGHLFHLSCLRSWLEHGSQAPYSCPTCRRPLDSLPPNVLSSLSPPPQPPPAAAAAGVAANQPPPEAAWGGGWEDAGGGVNRVWGGDAGQGEGARGGAGGGQGGEGHRGEGGGGGMGGGERQEGGERGIGGGRFFSSSISLRGIRFRGGGSGRARHVGEEGAGGGGESGTGGGGAGGEGGAPVQPRVGAAAGGGREAGEEVRGGVVGGGGGGEEVRGRRRGWSLWGGGGEGGQGGGGEGARGGAGGWGMGMRMGVDEDRMAAMVAQVEEVLPHVPSHAIRQELLRRPNVLLAVNALMDAW